MASEFNYDSPDADPIPIADAIRAQYRLPELTPAQKEQRRLEIEDWQEQERWRAEDRRAERERQQAEAEAAARHEAALEQAEQNRVARQERAERIRRETQARELADLRFQSTRQQAWQRNVDNAANMQMAFQYRNTLMGELDAMINPPQPQPAPHYPEQDIVYYTSEDKGSPDFGPDFNPALFNKKPRRWW